MDTIIDKDNNEIVDRPSLLLVDDDDVFCRVLSQALERRGFQVVLAHDVTQGSELAQQNPPEFAVVDLNMPGPSGLVMVEMLKQLDKHTKIVVLTGYSSVATAVEAVKLGATHYLTKPADIEEIINAFGREAGDASMEISQKPKSVNRLEWEHLQKVLMDCNNNISEAARRLGMHRRTLQRKLQKRPVRE
ncbi:MAG: response regulator transcription factor [Gammaproteobacteria bacterium]|nr:response regulator transcription factor [Gammaproteobacteria bacterium]MCF6229565.1 response regulator transcription factor [Gammaproteobacteria bacterium]